MASSIDITKPVSGSPTTASVRDNFSYAKTEIEALQTGKADLASPALTGTATAVNLTVSGTLTSSGTWALTGSWFIDGTQVTVTANELNKLDGLSGDVLTTTSTSTLTNKTYSNPAFTGGITEQVGTVTGTTPTIDPANGTIQTWTLTANSAPTISLSTGESLLLMINDGSSYTINWGTEVDSWAAGSAPTLGATGYTAIVLWAVGAEVFGAVVGTEL